MMDSGLNKHVLLIEDDPHIRIMLMTSLGANRFTVTVAADGDSGYRVAAESAVDLVLLDLGLPDMDGQRLIPLLHQISTAPVMVISARDQEQQKIAALDAGADDYIQKPFGVGELVARMNSVLRRRRSPAEAAPVRYHHQNLLVDLITHRVELAGQPVRLTPVEYRLLAVLARQPGRVITHRQLLREVWGPLHEEDAHYLRIYMRQLRRKLEVNPAEPRYLLNEPGVGYRLAHD
ncbi:MAG TPA: response regulator [Fluviicoccus sp.]|nr:response regulator [Fluviicoccus sp.]